MLPWNLLVKSNSWWAEKNNCVLVRKAEGAEVGGGKKEGGYNWSPKCDWLPLSIQMRWLSLCIGRQSIVRRFASTLWAEWADQDTPTGLEAELNDWPLSDLPWPPRICQQRSFFFLFSPLWKWDKTTLEHLWQLCGTLSTVWTWTDVRGRAEIRQERERVCAQNKEEEEEKNGSECRCVCVCVRGGTGTFTAEIYKFKFLKW